MPKEQSKPELSPTDSNSSPWWRSHLNVVGLFIGTHGLAVFLVVYYTMYLYPRSEAERATWIEQITRIRQLVEPETRALTVVQAEAVLSIARTTFVQNLDNAMRSERRFDSRGMSWSDDSIEIWGEHFRFKNKEDGVSARKELHDNLSTFNRLLEDRQRAQQESLIAAFDNTLESGQVLRYQLGRLRTEKGSLEDVWQSAANPLRQEWAKMIGAMSAAGRENYEVAEFDKFARRSPAFEFVKTNEPKIFAEFESPSSLGTDESPIRKLSNLLEQNLTKELQNAYKKN